ncbi:MAG: glutamine--fructose-6-phosphate transaminase (isomerizing) [Candidatus Cloacimonetes bacterium]|nr:glutamine--fructose-6-phosphate transaminase (isomerizing) [Candidatus Cloacimonadota bacterium]MCF7813286.1 glutamine--fructose-6-phosphate transaminase (isomerizing) [Candidatus Cloacimonadota bacterium]MCF7867361.1 glutamine--fructose-6-phosphate transaminase (isomerizing) [Candidatus Cloacimonadota bacterium]MCF7882795.1 glutamine--fructose-6-phosphate transaminase (isomerizing) [Candidatus Cloacimonadota bacterium]
MCGIVGYIGKRNATPIIVEGIKRLEYRGYDSSGLAIIDKNNELKVHKKPGKIIELERTLPSPELVEGKLGIAHTRWATHGKPTGENAHPHVCCHNKIALVHNGIIENYRNLRKKLESENHKFVSETDTEVLVHLIEHFEHDTKDLTSAVQEALKLVEGTFGIAVISSDHPGKMVAARKGSPLILGIGNHEFFVTSDVSAIIIHTKKVIYLKDNEIVTIDNDHFEITTLDNQVVKAKVSVVDWDVSSIDKGEYQHFMIKEIFEQPISVENAFRGRLVQELSTVRLGGLNMTGEELRRIKRMQIIACGTSWHAALIGKHIIENIARVPVEVEYASEYRYRNPIIPTFTPVFFISQSGETADTLAAMREAKAKGARVLGITNTVGSTIARESDGGVYIHAGAEIGVASTKAFTSQVTILTMLAVLLGRMRNISPTFGTAFIKELQKIPEKIQQILDQNDNILEIAKTLVDSQNALYLGRGVNFPVALEGALKLKEISYIHAEGYPAAEMKHGPIALIDENMPVVAIAPDDAIYDKIISNLQEVKARNGRIISIATEGDKRIIEQSESVIYIPRTIVTLQPLLSVIPLQLLAYHVANLRGLDVDQPRNLAKSVTVE